MKVIGRTASGSGVSSEVTILDSDTMSGASDSTLATSESIKAYVDNNVSSVTASSTTTFTNKTIDADGTGNSITNIEDANIKASAAIDATKIANGTVTSAEFQYLGDVTSLIQAQIDGKSPTAGSSSLTTVGTVASGIWEATDVAVAHGGTGSSTASAARTALGVAIGSDVQAFDAQLTDVAGLAVTDGNFIVGDGSNFVAESGSTARTSLGLGTIATQAANSVDIDGGAIDGAVIGANSAAAITGTTITGTQVDITAEGDLRLQDASGGQYVGFEAPATVSASYTLEMPAATGASGKVLKMSSSANVLEWGDAGGAAGNTIDTLLRDEADSDPSYTSRTENSASTPIQIWSKTLDSNNENLYVRVKKNGSYTNVQIA